MGSDRRTHGRFEIIGSLPGTLETWQRLGLRNLGPGGGLVESTVELPVGTRLNARLSVRGRMRDVKAEVRHSIERRKGVEGPDYLVGIEWVDGAPVDDLLPADATNPRRGPRPEGAERRRSYRASAGDMAELARLTWVTVQLLDISSSGVLFCAPERIAVGEKGQLRLRLGDRSFAGDIEIRRADSRQTKQGGYCIGAVFTSLADGSLAALKDFIGAAGD